MDISSSIVTITEAVPFFDPGVIRGTGVLKEGFDFIDLPDVIDANYQLILSISYTVENVGVINILSMIAALLWKVKGDGSTKWQISGDGGTTFTPITEVVFNEVGFTEIFRVGGGMWITSIDPGDNKLIIQLLAKANAGTVSTQLDDRSVIQIIYRKTLSA